MKKKIAIVNIFYENSVSIEVINDIFHEFRDYVIARMGLPYRLKKCKRHERCSRSRWGNYLGNY